jgi:hypothetical protein
MRIFGSYEGHPQMSSIIDNALSGNIETATSWYPLVGSTGRSIWMEQHLSALVDPWPDQLHP